MKFKEYMIESKYYDVEDLNVEEFELLLNNLHNNNIIQTIDNNFIKVYKKDNTIYYSRYIEQDEDIISYEDLDINVYNLPLRSIIKCLSTIQDKLNKQLFNNEFFVVEYTYNLENIDLDMFNNLWYSFERELSFPAYFNIRIPSLSINGEIIEVVEFWKVNSAPIFTYTNKDLTKLASEYRRWKNTKVDGRYKDEWYHLKLSTIKKEIRLHAKTKKIEIYNQHKQFIRKFNELLPDSYVVKYGDSLYQKSSLKPKEQIKKIYGSIYSTDKEQDIYVQGGLRGRMFADVCELIFQDRKLAKKSYYLENKNNIIKQILDKVKLQKLLITYYNELSDYHDMAETNAEKIAAAEVINYILHIESLLVSVSYNTDLIPVLFDRYENAKYDGK